MATFQNHPVKKDTKVVTLSSGVEYQVTSTSEGRFHAYANGSTVDPTTPSYGTFAAAEAACLFHNKNHGG